MDSKRICDHLKCKDEGGVLCGFQALAWSGLWTNSGDCSKTVPIRWTILPLDGRIDIVPREVMFGVSPKQGMQGVALRRWSSR